MTTDPRTGRAWQELLALCWQHYPHTCHLCGQTIPEALPLTHPLRYQADHLTTVHANPALAMRLDNLRPSHRRCNQARGNRPLTPALVQELTARFAPSRPALTFFNTTTT